MPQYHLSVPAPILGCPMLSLNKTYFNMSFLSFCDTSKADWMRLPSLALCPPTLSILIVGSGRDSVLSVEGPDIVTQFMSCKSVTQS